MRWGSYVRYFIYCFRHFKNKDHWWGLWSESKRFKVCNLLSYYFWILKPIINKNIVWNLLFQGPQVQIAKDDNTEQYWPNLGSLQSVTVIGPVSTFASFKCRADDRGLCRLFKFTDLQPKLGPVVLYGN